MENNINKGEFCLLLILIQLSRICKKQLCSPNCCEDESLIKATDVPFKFLSLEYSHPLVVIHEAASCHFSKMKRINGQTARSDIGKSSSSVALFVPESWGKKNYINLQRGRVHRAVYRRN